jgi:uncharacterized membrane protein
MPGAVAQSATLNADSLNLILPVVLAAWSIRLMLRYEARFDTASRFALAVLTISMGLLKPISAVFSLLILLVQQRRFRGKAPHRLYIAGAIGASLVVAASWGAIYPFVPGLYWKSTSADPVSALHALAADPLRHTAAILSNAWFALPHWLKVSYGRIGAHPNPDGTLYPPYICVAGLFSILLLAVSDGNRTRQARAAALIFGISLSYVALLLLSFRVAYNAPLDDGVGGVQERYFHCVEIMFLLAICLLGPWRGSERWRKLTEAASVGTALACQAATIIIVFGWLKKTWQ